MSLFRQYVLFMLLPFAVRGQTASALEVCLPLRHLKLNSGYGYRSHPLTGKLRFHAGVDLNARHDTVLAIMDGIVKQVGYDHLLGLNIHIKHASMVESGYGHLSECWVLPGNLVQAGDPIGISGATGRVTGEHLHLSVSYRQHFLDPLAFLNALLRSRDN